MLKLELNVTDGEVELNMLKVELDDLNGQS
ncbi:hypothetical protein A2U01_0119064, partial [Trifolium medium]|nr:hypothetical protein [Trifolium medium]